MAELNEISEVSTDRASERAERPSLMVMWQDDEAGPVEIGSRRR